MRTRYDVGGYVASEGSVLSVGRLYKPDATRMGVLYIHGAGEAAESPFTGSNVNKTGEYAIMAALAAAGYPVLSCDLGVPAAGITNANAWGNPNCLTRIGQAITYLQGAGEYRGAKTGKVLLLGVSMGNCGAVNYAAANPSNVAGIVSIIPVWDVEDIRTNDRGSYRASIGSAHGVTYPTALPAGRNPKDNAASLNGVVPYKCWYAADDTIAIASAAIAGAAAAGGAAVDVGNLGHSNAAVVAVDPLAVVSYFDSLGGRN